MNRLNAKLDKAWKEYNTLDHWYIGLGLEDMEEAWLESRDDFMFWQCIVWAVRKY